MLVEAIGGINKVRAAKGLLRHSSSMEKDFGNMRSHGSPICPRFTVLSEEGIELVHQILESLSHVPTAVRNGDFLR